MRYQSVHCISEVLTRVKTEIVGGRKVSPYTLINLSLDDD